MSIAQISDRITSLKSEAVRESPKFTARHVLGEVWRRVLRCAAYLVLKNVARGPQLMATLSDNEFVDWELFRLMSKHQLKALNEQILKHLGELGRRSGGPAFWLRSNTSRSRSSPVRKSEPAYQSRQKPG